MTDCNWKATETPSVLECVRCGRVTPEKLAPIILAHGEPKWNCQAPPCEHKREQIGEVECRVCPTNTRTLPVWECAKHGKCVHAAGLAGIKESERAGLHVCDG